MKNEVIPPDRLVISEGTSAGEEDIYVCVCVSVSFFVHVCVKQTNYFPRGLLFEYVIFQNILLEGYGLFILRAFIRCSVLGN